MSAKVTPSDQEQRERIASALDETLFVEAGAGTGKTTALVSRIVSLITSGKATVDGIAAITFTEAAAAELRDKVRRELEEQALNSERDQDEKARCFEAVRGLENASIQTLHSFAGALLRERPLEAGLPPNFEIVEEIEADIRFEERWQRWLNEVLESEAVALNLQKALNLGLRLESLRTVAKSFHDNYDLLPDGFPEVLDPPLEAGQRIIDAIDETKRLLPLAHDGFDDPLASHSNRVVELGDRLDQLGPTSDPALALLFRWGKLSCSRGRQGDWGADTATGINGCKKMKALLDELEGARRSEMEAVRRAVFIPLLESLRCFTMDYVKERRSLGKAEFHDLLVWARDLLRNQHDVRTYFQEHFTHILIDEFQDTDPIQAEIAFFLAGDLGRNSDCDECTDWTKMAIMPGKLFVVGDPKQSIYRFRRADIAAVEKVRELMGGDQIPLSQNFRCQKPIIDWVNLVFQNWMGDGHPGIQAPYIELAAWWSPPEVTPPLGVHWFGGSVEKRAADSRREEAEAIAAVLSSIKSTAWKVRANGESGLRTAEYRDVCILIPTRTGLQALEWALEDANIPYRVESQSLVLGTQDVRELLACLRAIDSPADQVALIAALRSSAFSCSDVELLQFVDNGGRFDCNNPGTAEGPVRDALEVLYRYHSERTWTPLDELIEKFIRELQMAEVCFGRQRPRERLRRLRFIVERARAFAQIEGNSLRSFMDWIEHQADENARMVESPIPESDEDAVRIMTIHGAKGLEFPIVILAGLGTTPRSTSDAVIFDRERHSVEVYVKPSSGPAFATESYELIQEQEQEANDAENVRLMYVAATRARDHLIVSLFHPEKNSRSPAAIIHSHASNEQDLWHELSLLPTGGISDIRETDTEESATDTEADREAWLKQRESVLQNASRPAAVAATTVASVYKEEAERGEVSYRRGRGGTSLGRAVHSVLQSVYCNG